MSLRPRYSLLTLLVLTALVAGGVKLWYGPHRAVERFERDVEFDFSYYRDWYGNRIIDGPRVTRTLRKSPPEIEIGYFRKGTWLNWHYSAAQQLGDSEESTPALLQQTDSPLSPAEWREFHGVIDREIKSSYPKDAKLRVYEGKCIIEIF